jgi:sulfonate transport system ATP-binding protein
MSRIEQQPVADRAARAAPPVPSSGSPRAAAVELIGVSKSFAETPVLHELDLQVAAGQFVALVGRSGCGKSTLLRLVAGLEQPTSGRLLVNGVSLQGLNRQARMMFQDARLLPWMRVAENVAVGQGGRLDATVRAALERVNLGHRASDWPAVLSGGQRQRVALARALVGNPPLLLLDEPLGALDALTRLRMQALVRRLADRHRPAVLLVTHDVEEAIELADRVVVLEGGRIAAELRLPPRGVERAAAFAGLRRRLLALLGVGADLVDAGLP